MSKKVLVATEKPFAKAAVDQIQGIIEGAGYEFMTLESYTAKEDLYQAVAESNALIIRSDKITAEVMEKAPNLEIVVRAGAGYDNVDLEAATSRNIVVMNTPGQNSNAVAELAIGMMIYLSRKCFSGKSGTELRGKKLGIHAYGYVGKFVAEIAKGFQMEIFAYDPYVVDDVMIKDGVKPVKSAEELYSICDFVSLHLPKMKATLGLINYDLLSKMKKGAMLVNTARAEVVDELGLVKMLEERPDFLYATDVAPADVDGVTAKGKDRVYMTPKKMGAQTAEANINAGIAAAEQIAGFFKNGDTTFQVNKA